MAAWTCGRRCLLRKIDFAPLEPGSKFKPAIGDDVRLTGMDTEDLKPFLDPSEEDALLWARWGGSSFEMNQSRQVCINPFDKDFEPKVKSISSIREVVSIADFLRPIRCNWPTDKKGDVNDADVEAYLSRAHIVLCTDDWIYNRFASSDFTTPVPRIPWPTPAKPDLFHRGGHIDPEEVRTRPNVQARGVRRRI